MFKWQKLFLFVITFLCNSLLSLLILKVATKMALHITVSKKWNTNYETQESWIGKQKKIKCFISPHSNWDEQYMCSLKRKNKPISSQIKDKYQGTLTNRALSVQNEKYKPKILIHYTGVFRSSCHKSEPLNTQISSNYGSLLAPVSCAWGRKK